MLTSSAVRVRRGVVWALSAVLAAVAIVVVILASTIPLSSDALRRQVVAALSERLDGEVTLDSLRLRLAPRLHIEGGMLTIHQRGDKGHPPLISIASFSADADLLGLIRRRVARVRLEGLDIEIPPDHDTDADERRRGDDASSSSSPADEDFSFARDITVDVLEAPGARLAIRSSKPDHGPKVWNIHQLRMQHVGISTTMPFEATLTNAVPPGEIQTTGSFGPWRRRSPGRTPLDGTFTFDHADLNVFRGINGILSAHGQFGGTLGRIDITGETDTPEFSLDIADHPVPLHTRYHSIVDGTNGDTILKRIDATILQSTLVAEGSVIDVPHVDGRTVTLDITMPQAHIEDLMRLAVRTPKPPMTGALQLTTHFVLPPGAGDVADRLRLNGQFAIARARFTNYDVQGKINGLSSKSRGRPDTGDKQSVVSEFRGRFTLADATLRLASLHFAVPGAVVQLHGRYGLRSEGLDFRGTLLMDAKVSQTMSGFKRVLMKAVDPLFNKHGGGSAVPIKIGGTRQKPAFGLDLGRVIKMKAD